VREFSGQYNKYLNGRGSLKITADNLKILGAKLFNTWFAQSWDKVAAKVPKGALRMLSLLQVSLKYLTCLGRFFVRQMGIS